jgi:isocitrate/isopropylmalate dehydrogenase
MKLRKGLDLYSNEVHITSFPGVCTKHKDIDLVIIRELTEGEYSGIEHESVPVRHIIYVYVIKFILFSMSFRMLLNI